MGGLKSWAKKVVHEVEDVAKGALEATAKPFETAWHTAQGVGYLAQGEFGKAGKKLSQAVGDFAYMSTYGITGGLVPKLAKKTADVAGGLSAYALGNFNVGSERLEHATGFDLDNSKAEAAAAAAQRAAEEAVAQANQLAENERKAKLFSLRKQVGIRNVGASSIWGSGSASSSTKDEQTGIILG